MTKLEILKSLNKVIRLYTTRGFTIQQIMADNQFKCLRDDLLLILLTIVGAENMLEISNSPSGPLRRVPEQLPRACLSSNNLKFSSMLLCRKRSAIGTASQKKTEYQRASVRTP